MRPVVEIPIQCNAGNPRICVLWGLLDLQRVLQERDLAKLMQVTLTGIRVKATCRQCVCWRESEYCKMSCLRETMPVRCPKSYDHRVVEARVPQDIPLVRGLVDIMHVSLDQSVVDVGIP